MSIKIATHVKKHGHLPNEGSKTMPGFQKRKSPLEATMGTRSHTREENELSSERGIEFVGQEGQGRPDLVSNVVHKDHCFSCGHFSEFCTKEVYFLFT